MGSVDYYELLGLSQFASIGAVRKAFRASVLNAHPDCNPQDPLALERTRELLEAYRMLSDPESKRLYDLTLSTPVLPESQQYRPAQITSEPQPTSFRRWIAYAGLVVCAALAIFYAAVATQPKVYRFDMSTLSAADEPRLLPFVVQPDPTDTIGWYYSQECGVTLAAGWNADQTERAYSEAAEESRRAGNTARQQFYESVLQSVHRARLVLDAGGTTDEDWAAKS